MLLQLQERGNQMVCLVFPEMLGRTGFGGYKEKSQMPMYTWTPTHAFNAHACADTHAHTHTHAYACSQHPRYTHARIHTLQQICTQFRCVKFSPICLRYNYYLYYYNIDG